MASILAASLLVLVFLAAPPARAQTKTAAVSENESSITYPAMPGLDGRLLNPATWRGKVVVVNFFASWCGACRLEIPQLVRFNSLFSSKNVLVVGLAVDPPADRELVMAMVRELKINYQLAFARRGDVAAFGGAPKVPTTLILDRRGKIIFRHVGYINTSELSRRISKLLQEQPPLKESG